MRAPSRVTALVLLGLLAAAAAQTPCPVERCPSCQSVCDANQDATCTSWCYNAGPAPMCKEHCYNLGSAPACEDFCFSAIGGFNRSFILGRNGQPEETCSYTCVDPVLAVSTTDYYPRQSQTVVREASIEAVDQSVHMTGKNVLFSLGGAKADVLGLLRKDDLLDDSINKLENRALVAETDITSLKAADQTVSSAINQLNLDVSAAESKAANMTAALEGVVAANLKTFQADLANLQGGTSGNSIGGNSQKIVKLEADVKSLKGTGTGASVTGNRQSIVLLEQANDALLASLLNQTSHPELDAPVGTALVGLRQSVEATTMEATNNTAKIGSLEARLATLTAQTATAARASSANTATIMGLDAKYVPQADGGACTTFKQNLLRINNNIVQRCDNKAWVTINSGPAPPPAVFLPNGCSGLLQQKPGTPDGKHSVSVKSQGATHYCLMSKGGLSLGGDGSNAPNAGLSCEIIWHRFAQTANKLYYVNTGLNAQNGGQAVQVFCRMSALANAKPGGAGTSASDAASSCAALKAFHPLTAATSGAYFVLGPYAAGGSPPQLTFCDMTTEGGGWTLVAKVQGQSVTMNARNTAQWRDGKNLGSVSSLADSPALGSSYSSVPFTDVMIRSLADPKKRLGWRHGTRFENVRKIIQGCSPISSGKKLFGSVFELDHAAGLYPERYRDCSELDFGFLLSDHTYTYVSIAGCSPTAVPMGHSGGIFSASTPKAGSFVYGRDDGSYRRCVTNWGMGSGYYQMNNVQDSYAINGHWWGNGNEDIFEWRSHGAFVREVLSATVGGDGASAATAGKSCNDMKTQFGLSGIKMLFVQSPTTGEVVQGVCDFGQNPAAYLGGEGNTRGAAGLRCDTIAEYFPSTRLASGSYWLLDPERGAVENYCDMITEGGGWTMLLKVVGEDATMNTNAVTQWKAGQPIGPGNDLTVQNTLTHLYNTASFQDVMIISLGSNNLHRIGWRHPSTYTSLHDIVTACKPIDDGKLLFGAIDHLSYVGSNKYWNACSGLRYGFLLADYTYTYASVAGCPSSVPFGHSGGVVGASIPQGPWVYGKDDGVYRRCISNFNIGSDYQLSSRDDQHAINAHWWGLGNEQTHTWNDHAVFVRSPGTYLSRFDGRGRSYPGRSCAALKAAGKTATQMYWLLTDGASKPSDAIEAICDMSGAGVNLGNDGSSATKPGLSCHQLLTVHKKTSSQAYYIQGLRGLGVLTYCDMTTEGGGWTLVAKVLGENELMNANNLVQWRQGVPLGDASTLTSENALTEAYSVTPFSDVMIRSPGDSSKKVGWRHPGKFSSVRDIVGKCQTIADGKKLFGSFFELDHPTGGVYNGHYKDCTELRFGFLVPDYTYEDSQVAGCFGTPFGHAAGVFGGGIPNGNWISPRDNGKYRACLSNFGIGSGYYQMSTADDRYAVNAHWWGSGNDHVNVWGNQAVFIR